MEAIRIRILASLCEEVTQKILAKHGTVRMQCNYGANQMVKAAKTVGIQLEKAAGFYGWSQHNWAIDRVTGNIYDPTASQFYSPNGEITPEDPHYKNYDEVPREYLAYIGAQSSKQRQNWQQVKKWIPYGLTATVGENKEEWRTSKRGDRYFYFQQKIQFTPTKNKDVRSGLIFETRRGWKISLIVQHRVVKDGKVRFPTRVEVWTVMKGGMVFRVEGGKSIFVGWGECYLPSRAMSAFKDNIFSFQKKWNDEDAQNMAMFADQDSF